MIKRCNQKGLLFGYFANVIVKHNASVYNVISDCKTLRVVTTDTANSKEN
jgi:hypothetical protein